MSPVKAGSTKGSDHRHRTQGLRQPGQRKHLWVVGVVGVVMGRQAERGQPGMDKSSFSSERSWGLFILGSVSGSQREEGESTEGLKAVTQNFWTGGQEHSWW